MFDGVRVGPSGRCGQEPLGVCGFGAPLMTVPGSSEVKDPVWPDVSYRDRLPSSSCRSVAWGSPLCSIG